jgi:hypothetical protein
MIADAHHKCANYENGVSEFEKTNLEEEYKEGMFLLQKEVRFSYTQIFK